MKSRIPSAADDLGLTAESRVDYGRRVALLFEEGCIILGPEAAAKLFREHARNRSKILKRRKQLAPPRKRKGPHDPIGDRLLLELWTFGSNGMNKRDFARVALKNHAIKINGKIRPLNVAVDSLVRRLNRVIQRANKVRQ